MAVTIEPISGPIPSRSDWPAHLAVAVTPSDSTVQKYRSLYVGTTGNISLVPLNGESAVLFTSVPVGILPVAVSKVMATSTTASNIVGLV